MTANYKVQSSNSEICADLHMDQENILIYNQTRLQILLYKIKILEGDNELLSIITYMQLYIYAVYIIEID